MLRLGWIFVVALLAAIPVVGFEKPLVPQREIVQPAFPGQPGNPAVNYTPPKADGPIVELLDEGVEAIFPQLINDGGGEPGTITREERDVFAGVEAVRVTPVQKYRTRIPGWNFKIAEKPKAEGEHRYLRFAWKKHGGAGIMVQFHDPVKSWSMRYFAGQNAVGWQPAVSVSDKVPVEWDLVTCDLYKDHGAFNMTGFALTAMYGEGTVAFFDHMLLGRTIEDLDKATDAALGKVKPAKALAGKERDALWTDLGGTDRPKAATALRAFLSTAPDQVEFLRARLAVASPDKEFNARVRKLIADLDADDFDVRDAATEALIKIGAPSAEMVRSLVTNGPSDEVKYRARLILKRLGVDGAPESTAGKMARVVRVLERAGTKDARDMLTRIAAGEFGADGAAGANLALARLQKK